MNYKINLEEEYMNWKEIATIAHTHRDEFYKASIAIEIDIYIDREDWADIEEDLLDTLVFDVLYEVEEATPMNVGITAGQILDALWVEFSVISFDKFVERFSQVYGRDNLL
jgi:hypothetical protein